MILTNDNERKRAALLLVATTVLVFAGCSHRLEIRNLNDYRATSINPLAKRLSIGIVSSEEDPNMKLLIKQVGVELQKYSSEVVLPYTMGDARKVDVVADVRVAPEYRGSGANFFVNFPGFLVWAPAWHGYNYKVRYNVKVMLVDPRKSEKVDEFSTNIDLNIRHAQMDRTWTELSWLEVGVIALVGGIYCINYDPDVTPLVASSAAATVGEHISSEIVNRINASGRFAYLEPIFIGPSFNQIEG